MREPSGRSPVDTPEFDEATTRRAMRLSVAEAWLYAIMISFGEAFFVANAVRLGASPAQVGLQVALPLGVGAVAAIGVPRALRRLGRRKVVVLSCVALQVVVLTTLALGELAGWITPRLLLGLACAYQALGQTAGVAWGSWYGDLVPSEVRGRYFSRRSRLAHLVMLGGFVGAGSTLQALEPGSAGVVAAGTGGVGFAVVFGVAAVARIGCWVLLALAPEPRFYGMATARSVWRELVPSKAPSTLRRVVVAAFALQLAVSFGSPYFSPFMLEVLELTYFEYTAGTMTVVAVKFLTLGFWGRAIDRRGARAVYVVALFVIAIVPLPWTVADGVMLVIVGQALSGLGWGGQEVSSFALMLETADANRRPALLAVTNAMNGAAQVLGALLGGWLLSTTATNYVLVFLASAGLRLVVAVGVWATLPPPSGPIERKTLRLRIAAFSPFAGAVYRPLPAATPEPSDEPQRTDR